jgi:hypothetical protein
MSSQLLPAMIRDGVLDTSNYASDSPLYSQRYENQVGLFKDESGGKEVFEEWIFLRPKCYSMLTQSDSKHKAKGIMRDTALHHQQYLDVYSSFNPTADEESPPSKRVCVEQRSIRSDNHQLQTVRYSKVALSVLDDKRCWLKQNFSLPYGHYAIDLYDIFE